MDSKVTINPEDFEPEYLKRCRVYDEPMWWVRVL